MQQQDSSSAFTNSINILPANPKSGVPKMSLNISGTYDFQSAENFDEYLKGLGVGLVFRKVQSVAKPSLEITYASDSEEWTIKFQTPFKTQVQRYKVGVPIDDETYDARKCKTTANIDGDKFVLIQECNEGPKVTVTKELTDTGLLKMTLAAGGLSSTHLFQKKD